MESVTLKSKYGPTMFKDTVRIVHDNGKASYERREFRFGFDNDFRVQVPEETWERLADQPFDRTMGLAYRDAFQKL
jgi:hypothetical protein